MTETERRYKILKKTSYEEQISKESKKITDETYWLGLTAAAVMCTFSSAANANTNEILRLLATILGTINTFGSAICLKKIIESISIKTMLRGKVEDINDELAMEEQVPSLTRNR